MAKIEEQREPPSYKEVEAEIQNIYATDDRVVQKYYQVSLILVLR